MADKNLQWKQKYYDSLDDIERREEKWQTLEDLFKQAISRLTLAAEGNSKNLDGGLVQLRTAIRKGKDNLVIETILEDVSKEIIKLDNMSQDGPKGDAGFLINIIEQMSLSGKAEKKSRKFIKRLKAKKAPEKKELLMGFTDLLSEIIQQSVIECEKNAGNSSAKQSFLKNLFASKKTARKPSAESGNMHSSEDERSDKYDFIDSEDNISLNQEQMSSVVATVQNVLESIIDGLDISAEVKETLKNKVFEVKPTKEIHVLLGDLQEILHDSGLVEFANKDCPDNNSINNVEHNELLIRLIEYLPLEDEVKENAEQLKENFAQGVSTEQLPKALKSIAALISKMRSNVQQEQKQFERFLKSLTGRLAEVDQYLQNNLVEYKQSYQNGLDLGDVVKEQVKSIGDSVSSFNNIGEVEQAVQSHLDKILTHIDLHREKENERVNRVEEKNKQLSQQLKQLESESGKLRQQVIESQNKAMLDQLTQLPNRMAYDERLHQEYVRWKRYNTTLIIIIWDIDFFKKVNDTYGHQAGDKVLKVVADLLRKNLRETDFVARFGGEEFVGLMPETTLGGGFKIAEKIRNAIEKLEFHYRGDKVKVTISCGISLFMENDTSETALARADKALYQAKSEGRNRCVIAKEA
ncbi:GGDEF domain-containing protein [sulfur-oxidizing endosymbiont of Gigantopelta aegis]|uniref:GGDEF domain-containing protein n=1 Tax=sulfur-oxidizing endosymbiont of Gigantopelta aegis TaxID=2794934 RepID=UPI0018DE1B66|nr:GGDEF domain-containing protein [sulfur-oxidizing endosymbiont of Gigantopelta aegis]